MNKNFISLGLMSGTSGDGIDTSLVNSDGDKNCEIIVISIHLVEVELRQ